MAQDVNNVGLKVRPFDADKVFLMVNDPFRRRVILSLAGGEMKVAAQLSSPSAQRRHNKLKHLTALCNAGIVVKKENPQDARKPLFGLAPSVVVCKEENCLTVNLGCYTLRSPSGK